MNDQAEIDAIQNVKVDGTRLAPSIHKPLRDSTSYDKTAVRESEIATVLSEVMYEIDKTGSIVSSLGNQLDGVMRPDADYGDGPRSPEAVAKERVYSTKMAQAIKELVNMMKSNRARLEDVSGRLEV